MASHSLERGGRRRATIAMVMVAAAASCLVGSVAAHTGRTAAVTFAGHGAGAERQPQRAGESEDSVVCVPYYARSL